MLLIILMPLLHCTAVQFWSACLNTPLRPHALTIYRLRLGRRRPVDHSHRPDLLRHLFKVLHMEVPREVVPLVGLLVPMLALLLQQNEQGLTICRVKSNVTAVTSLFAATRSEDGVGLAYHHHRRHSWYHHCAHPHTQHTMRPRHAT